MSKTRGRTGVSKLAVPAALAVVVVVAGAYVFLTGNPGTPPPSSTSTGLPSFPVRNAVNQLLQDINDRNIDAAVTLYAPSSVVVWGGSSGGLVGKYNGPSNVRLIYATSVGKTSKLDANISGYAEKPFSATNINATYVMSMLANSTVMGTLNATIHVSEQWNWGGAGWQIAKENWLYTFFYASALQNGNESTTFPQWAIMKAGGNPNLVSEKSFEWHAGPYVAAAVYAFLVGILFFFVVRPRQREREMVRQSEKTTSLQATPPRLSWPT